MKRDEFDLRRREIVYLIARKAFQTELRDSGFWFHRDIRDNYYYASYLFAAAVDESLKAPFDKEAAKRKATGVLLNVLQLQDRDEKSETYGHWPLSLEPSPLEAKAHPLPAELMSVLMAYFFRTYASEFEPELRIAFAGAFRHIYASRFFVKGQKHFGHHDAKYTAAKLIYGQLFKDPELARDGHRELTATLAHIRENGMSEYGSLPWFWHWVQAFTAAWEMNEDPKIHGELEEMLDYLWNERSLYYLKGAWVGPHSRGWPHDMPKDSNVLFDYVQYGDFLLPEEMPRTEYAGVLFYEAPREARRLAMNRKEPAEVKRSARANRDSGGPIHKYVYITEHYAAGGAWERADEFDNEQLRWDVTLPLSDAEEDTINQAYFFHPGEGFADGDPRHQSGYAEVLYHRNAILALYPIPDGADSRVIGVLPKGRWLQEPRALFGQAENVYFSIHLMKEYRLEERKDRFEVTSGIGENGGAGGEETGDEEGSLSGGGATRSANGLAGANGIAMEVLSLEEAERLGIGSLEEFAELRGKAPIVFTVEAPGRLQADYTTLSGDRLRLALGESDKPARTVNGEAISFGEYRP
ncbi:hypothetical protein [Cohnella thailandensis]|uniref:DUF2264 domain-containing protein n=1 Tax=Cohnella thailandensis TaxID=557557 RepID=A0A841SW11_9BACL|nr:hypothetical protein [Cohnella thailandensis]MBB6635159.1 hypothetical protein [Cohnella thailandensis]MBP1974375.1 hypothetical protein [Cohnella thailandensis]